MPARDLKRAHDGATSNLLAGHGGGGAMLILLAVLAGFLAAPIAPLLTRLGLRREAGWLLPLIPLAVTIYLTTLIGTIADGGTATASWE